MRDSWLCDASVSFKATLLNFYTRISVHIGKNMPTDDYSTGSAARSDTATHLARGLAHQACMWHDISSVVPCKHRTRKQGQQLSTIPSKVVNIKVIWHGKLKVSQSGHVSTRYPLFPSALTTDRQQITITKASAWADSPV